MSFSRNHQKGLTFISILFILGLIAFFALLTFKIAPIYMNHNKVTNALNALEDMPNVESLSKRDISKSLYKRFGMNYVDHIGDDDITIIKQENYVKVDIEYERVEKIIGNLSVLVYFHDFFEAGGTE